MPAVVGSASTTTAGVWSSATVAVSVADTPA